MMIEEFKRQRLATPIKHHKENRSRLRSPAIVNRDLWLVSPQGDYLII